MIAWRTVSWLFADAVNMPLVEIMRSYNRQHNLLCGATSHVSVPGKHWQLQESLTSQSLGAT